MIKKKISIVTVIIFMINYLQIQCLAFDAPTFYVTDSSGYAGNELEVEVRIENNPGIISCLLLVNYDSQYLSLIEVQSGDFEDVSFGPIENSPFSLMWSDGLHDNNVNDGCLAKLKFKISDSAPIDSFPISLSYDSENVFNFNEENVDFDTSDGIVSIIKNMEKEKTIDSETITNSNENHDVYESENDEEDDFSANEAMSNYSSLINDNNYSSESVAITRTDNDSIIKNTTNSSTGMTVATTFSIVAILFLFIIIIKKH